LVFLIIKFLNILLGELFIEVDVHMRLWQSLYEEYIATNIFSLSPKKNNIGSIGPTMLEEENANCLIGALLHGCSDVYGLENDIFARDKTLEGMFDENL
jgi:hypothetical protein